MLNYFAFSKSLRPGDLRPQTEQNLKETRKIYNLKQQEVHFPNRNLNKNSVIFLNNK